MTAHRTVLMTVDTLHLDWLAIQVVIASSQFELVILGLCIAYFNLTEAEICRSQLYRIALLVEKRNHQCISVRFLCTPLCRSRNRDIKLQGLSVTGKNLINSNNSCCTLDNLVLVAVQCILVELCLNLEFLHLLCSKVTHVNLYVRNSILVLFVELGAHTYIAYFERV